MTQADLGKRVETSGNIIGRHERDHVMPSIEVVILMADVLEVSLDLLVGNTDSKLDTSTLTASAKLPAFLMKTGDRCLWWCMP